MSDSGAQPQPHWVPSPLLLKPRETPRFLRAPWDAQAADAFGPWRLGARVDPALTPHEFPADAGGAGGPGHPAPTDVADAPEGRGEVIDVAARALDPTGEGGRGASPEAAAEAEARGHARGLEEGRAQAMAEMEDERAREAELVRHLAIELRALSEDPDRFFEPLRRLALHIAEQLVRGELQTSGQAIAQIVRQALAALDPPPGEPVLVCVHPDDAALLQSMSPSFLEGLKLQPEPQLHRGSVRLRLDDTVLEDLVEQRLQALVDRLLVHPGGNAGAMPRESVLLREVPTGASSARRRPAGLGDVIDVPSHPTQHPPQEPAQ